MTYSIKHLAKNIIHKRVGALVLTLFVLLLPFELKSQNPKPHAGTPAYQKRTAGEDACVPKEPQAGTPAYQKRTAGEDACVPKEPRAGTPAYHSPSHALMLSAILPGTGQIYNKQAWKVPVIYVAIGGIGYYTYNNFKQMRYYRDEYLYRVANNDQTQYPDDPDMVATPTSNIYNMYEAYNKTFQLSVILSFAVYSINLLDAYVFGHLYDFQINDDLTLNMSPVLMTSGGCSGFSNVNFVPAASFTLSF